MDQELPPADGVSDLIVDLEESIDRKPWGLFQKLNLLFAALAFAVDGWANQVLGVAMPALIPELGGGSRAAFASVAAAGLLGVALGTALGGIAGDRLGRRVALIGSVLLFGAATCCCSQAHSITALAAIRFLDGIGLGGAIPNGAALVSEFTPLRRRSLAIGFCMTFIPVGGVLAGLAGSLILPTWGWRPLFVVTGAAAFALGGLFFFVLPESPSFLINRPQRRAELLRILGRFGFGFSSDIEFHKRRGQGRPTTSFAALFGRGSGRDTIALWVGFFASMMASYSMFSWLPTLLADRGFGLAQSSLGMTGFNSGGMLGGLLAGLALTAFGSRAPSLGLAFGAALGAFGLGIIPLGPQHGMAVLIATFAVEGALVSGLQTATYALAASVYPPYIRATGIGAAAAFGRLGAVASSYTGVIAISVANGSYYFVYIAGVVAVCAVALSFIKTHTGAHHLLARGKTDGAPGSRARQTP